MVGRRGVRRVVLGLLAGLPWLLGLPGAGARAAETPVQTVETAHYRLHLEGSAAEAEEAGRVLEAAWDAFAAWFGATPTLADGERLTIRFYAGAEAWAEGLRAAGSGVPHGAGGYYWPRSRTAYLYRQPTTYFTRTLLLHEAAHQFHFLTRTRNRMPRAGWYVEGLAEFLSWHRWDGERLVLGVIPGVTLKDYPAKALAEVAALDFDLGAVVSGGVPASRALSWALVAYLATGRDGGPVPGFDAFRRRMDRGGRAEPLFERHFGRPGALATRLRTWLEANQTPWTQVFNEWEQIGPARFRGHAGVVTACRLKHPARRLAARIEPPGQRRWRAGLLLHWTSNDDYTVAMISPWGGLRVDRRQDGRWVRLARQRLERPRASRPVPIEAVRSDGAVTLRVDGAVVGRFALPEGSLGLCLEGADVRFDDVRWE